MDAVVYKQRTNAIKQAMQDALHTRGCNRQHDALITVLTDAVEIHAEAVRDAEYMDAKKVVKDVDASIKDVPTIVKDAMGVLGISKFECDAGTASFTKSHGYDLVKACEDNPTLFKNNILMLLGAVDKFNLDAITDDRLKAVIKAYTTESTGALRFNH